MLINKMATAEMPNWRLQNERRPDPTDLFYLRSRFTDDLLRFIFKSFNMNVKHKSVLIHGSKDSPSCTGELLS